VSRETLVILQAICGEAWRKGEGKAWREDVWREDLWDKMLGVGPCRFEGESRSVGRTSLTRRVSMSRGESEQRDGEMLICRSVETNVGRVILECAGRAGDVSDRMNGVWGLRLNGHLCIVLGLSGKRQRCLALRWCFVLPSMEPSQAEE